VEIVMRMIAVMKIFADGKIEGPRSRHGRTTMA
jgi:hypothetical protein